ncbi:hypothetical protein CYMTET_10264 [Cymbomonas tetramitiformis]|uniref:JmjC domain-containing protein n=1 Tax=Cymbomonas tetramitiformis TaxID=36881 RepID=A0AAE0LEM6_9CHLO|nr:hypothetical protein CYMTET_10264 [Cymbomonas tetramitiformis]
MVQIVFYRSDVDFSVSLVFHIPLSNRFSQCSARAVYQEYVLPKLRCTNRRLTSMHVSHSERRRSGANFVSTKRGSPSTPISSPSKRQRLSQSVPQRRNECELRQCRRRAGQQCSAQTIEVDVAPSEHSCEELHDRNCLQEGRLVQGVELRLEETLLGEARHLDSIKIPKARESFRKKRATCRGPDTDADKPHSPNNSSTLSAVDPAASPGQQGNAWRACSGRGGSPEGELGLSGSSMSLLFPGSISEALLSSSPPAHSSDREDASLQPQSLLAPKPCCHLPITRSGAAPSTDAVCAAGAADSISAEEPEQNVEPVSVAEPVPAPGPAPAAVLVKVGLPQASPSSAASKQPAKAPQQFLLASGWPKKAPRYAVAASREEEDELVEKQETPAVVWPTNRFSMCQFLGGCGCKGCADCSESTSGQEGGEGEEDVEEEQDWEWEGEEEECGKRKEGAHEGDNLQREKQREREGAAADVNGIRIRDFVRHGDKGKTVNAHRGKVKSRGQKQEKAAADDRAEAVEHHGGSSSTMGPPREMESSGIDTSGAHPPVGVEDDLGEKQSRGATPLPRGKQPGAAGCSMQSGRPKRQCASKYAMTVVAASSGTSPGGQLVPGTAPDGRDPRQRIDAEAGGRAGQKAGKVRNERTGRFTKATTQKRGSGLAEEPGRGEDEMEADRWSAPATPPPTMEWGGCKGACGPTTPQMWSPGSSGSPTAAAAAAATAAARVLTPLTQQWQQISDRTVERVGGKEQGAGLWGSSSDEALLEASEALLEEREGPLLEELLGFGEPCDSQAGPVRHEAPAVVPGGDALCKDVGLPSAGHLPPRAQGIGISMLPVGDPILSTLAAGDGWGDGCTSYASTVPEGQTVRGRSGLTDGELGMRPCAPPSQEGRAAGKEPFVAAEGAGYQDVAGMHSAGVDRATPCPMCGCGDGGRGAPGMSAEPSGEGVEGGAELGSDLDGDTEAGNRELRPDEVAVTRAVAATTAEGCRTSRVAEGQWAQIGVAVTPEELLAREPGGALRHPAVVDALETQGAIKVQVGDAWDEQRGSRLLNVSWLQKYRVRGKSLQGEFHHIWQSLPDSRGRVTGTSADEYSEDMPFGTMTENLQKTFHFAAAPLTCMTLAQREQLFLQQARSKAALQYQYLLGIALEAFASASGASAEQKSAPLEAHPWEPRAVASAGVLREALKQCEERCAPRAEAPAATGEAGTEKRRGRAKKVPESRGGGAGEVKGASSGDDEPGVRTVNEPAPPAGDTGDADTDTKRNADMRHTSAAALAEQISRGAAPGQGAEARPERPLTKKAQRNWGSGIVSPWLYMMGFGSTFCLHFEDYAFGSANVVLAPPKAQAWVVWYSVPRSALRLLHQFLQESQGAEYSLSCLEDRQLWFDPADVTRWRSSTGDRIPVYRHVQGPGEYILTDYGSVHWGVNLGVGWKAAVNFAFPGWAEKAKEVDDVYSELEKETGQYRHPRCAPSFNSERCLNQYWAGSSTPL